MCAFPAVKRQFIKLNVGVFSCISNVGFLLILYKVALSVRLSVILLNSLTVLKRSL